MTAANPGPGGKSPLLGSAFAACRNTFVAVVFFSLCINILMLTAPLYMLQVFDRVIGAESVETLIFLSLIAGAALLTLGLLEGVRGRVMVRLGTWLDQRLGGELLKSSVVAAVQRNRDEWSSRGPSIQGLRDLSTVRTFLTGPSMFPIIDAPWTPIFIAAVFMLHPVLGWMTTGGALFLLALAVANDRLTNKPLKAAGGASIAALKKAEAAARNADVIQAMGMMPHMTDQWRRDNARMLDLQAQASNRAGMFTAASKFFRMVLQMGMLGTGAWLVLQNELTAGAMIAGSILLGRALAPVDQAMGSWKSSVGARAAYGRIKRQLDETWTEDAAVPLPAPEGQITVEGMSFHYPGASEPILHGVNFRLDPGESLGIIGPTAAGKTTLARLLVGNMAPHAGHVRLDTADIWHWPADDLGRHVGYLPQDIELFSASVAENIARMAESDTDSVIEAAKLADVHEMILRLDKGYDTQIGEGGAALSGGQLQRIALARALFGNPRLVVLDEPNANLDSTGETALTEALATLKKRGVTLIVIAHRPNVLRHVDKILLMRNGAPPRFGPRDEILDQLSGAGPAPQKRKDESHDGVKVAQPA